MRKFITGLALLLLLAPSLSAQETARTLTLEQVIKHALGINESVAQAREDVSYSELLRRAAWSAFFPQVNLSGGLTRNDTEVAFSFGDNMEEITIKPLWDYSVNLHIGSPIYQGGYLYKTVEQSGLNIELNKVKESRAELDLMFQVSAAAAVVVKAQREVGIAEVSLELAQRQLKNATILFNAGEAIRTSVTRAEAQVAEAEVNLISAHNHLDQAKQDLRTLADLPTDYDLIELTMPALPSANADELVKIGMSKRVELIELDKQQSITNLEAEKAFSAKLPHLEWGYNYTKMRAGFPSSESWQAVLNVTWNLYDSGLSTVQKAQQESIIRKLELSRQLLTRQISAEILKSFMDYTSATKAREAAERALKAARQAYEDTERFYQAGEATDLDVQDLRKQLINAETVSANLETDEKLALFRLRHALGLPVIDLPEAN